MGKSGQATEWTSQQILDKEVVDEIDYEEYFKSIINELKKLNIHLSIITENEIGDKDAN